MARYEEIALYTTSNYKYGDRELYHFSLVKGEHAKSLFKAHQRSINHYGIRDLNDCYTKPSQAKIQAYDYCENMALNYQSNDYTITGYNSNQFSFSFTFKHYGKLYLAYITKDYNYLVLLSEFLG